MVDGYKMLFKEQNILGAYWNTIVIAVGTMVISLSLTSLMAYVMMVPDFVLRKQLSVFLLITMFFSGGTVPTYLLIQNLGLYNSWWSLILPNAVTAYNVFVYRSFYKGISPGNKGGCQNRRRRGLENTDEDICTPFQSPLCHLRPVQRGGCMEQLLRSTALY